ncbi:MAG: exosortase/archaeosortase family protein [Luteolibacter sp.]
MPEPRQDLPLEQPSALEIVKESLRTAAVHLWAFLKVAGPALLVIGFFYAGLRHFGSTRGETAVHIWTGAWNKESDFEHGVIFPFLLVGLLIWRRKEIMASRGEGEWLGLIPAIFGAVLFILSYRTLQWRVAIIGLPFLLTGSVWYLWGRRTAWLLVFPFFLIWLAIPVGFLQQATGGLQLIATRLAHAGASLCGIPTTILGNKLIMGDGTGFDVDEGCSGIRSLWALMLIASAWTYVARMPLWKRAALFISAFPIAIIGNALRLISIFIIAKYSGADFAGRTWHDWSPLVFFYPFSLFLLMTVHSILEGGLPWRARNRREVRRTVVTRTTVAPSQAP